MTDMKCTVLVPKIDRHGIEFPRIPCKVVRVLENGYYELVCSAGVRVFDEILTCLAAAVKSKFSEY